MAATGAAAGAPLPDPDPRGLRLGTGGGAGVPVTTPVFAGLPHVGAGNLAGNDGERGDNKGVKRKS